MELKPELKPALPTMAVRLAEPIDIAFEADGYRGILIVLWFVAQKRAEMIGPNSRSSRTAADHIQRARTVHVAEGLLMGLLQIALEDALSALITVGRTSNMSTYVIASALVSAVNSKRPLDHRDPATAVVLYYWGDEILTRDVDGHVSV